MLISSTTLLADYYYRDGKKEILTKIPTQKNLKNRSTHEENIDYYRDRSGNKKGVNDTLIVAFKDISIQKEIEKKFSLSLLDALSEVSFLYKVADKNLTLSTANKLSNTKGIAYAYPNFIIQKRSRTNDPLYGSSWHLENSDKGINVEGAWRYTKGAGIRVAVYDEGIDLEHEDLRNNIIGYGNFSRSNGQIDMLKNQSNNVKNAPQPASDAWHGTSCAGLMVAEGDNERGSVGVAPEAKLIALRYADNTAGDIRAYKAMDRESVSVISNSWGTYQASYEFKKLLKNLSENGRHGKGTLIFFAAGNDGCNMDKYYKNSSHGYACTNDSRYATIDDESESPYVISISASTQYNSIASYSNYGSAIDFAAPGSEAPISIITTDAMGNKGTKFGNYTRTFSGTSAAAPIAAGIATLILSVNPELSKEEVIDIMKQTAKKIGGHPYDANGRNDYWGYGQLNAGDAVTLAKNYGVASVENFAQKIYKDMH